MKKLTFVIFVLIFTFQISQAQEKATTTKVCRTLYSLEINSEENTSVIQKYLKENFYNALKITGKVDAQTNYYLKEFQADYGLRKTGKLDLQTISYLKKINSCINIEKTFTKINTPAITTSTSTKTEPKYKDPIGNFWIIYDLLLNHVYPDLYSKLISTTTISNTTVSTTTATTTN